MKIICEFLFVIATDIVRTVKRNFTICFSTPITGSEIFRAGGRQPPTPLTAIPNRPHCVPSTVDDTRHYVFLLRRSAGGRDEMAKWVRRNGFDSLLSCVISCGTICLAIPSVLFRKTSSDDGAAAHSRHCGPSNGSDKPPHCVAVFRPKQANTCFYCSFLKPIPAFLKTQTTTRSYCHRVGAGAVRFNLF